MILYILYEINYNLKYYIWKIYIYIYKFNIAIEQIFWLKKNSKIKWIKKIIQFLMISRLFECWNSIKKNDSEF